ncbi:MAG: universal stress protein [Isosphaeraceae bacterium]
METLPDTAQNVFHHAVWLAGKTGARLTFLSAIDLTAILLDDLTENNRLVLTRTIDADAGRVLTELVRQAKEQGVEAESIFVHGKGWLELIQQVSRGRHDLLLVGARALNGADVRRILMGSTAQKLVRRCPCPVWVTRPGPLDQPLNVLVANDLKPVSEPALRLAVELGQALDANLHLLHVAEYPLFSLCLTSLPDEIGPDYQNKVRARAEQTLRAQLDQATLGVSTKPIQVHLMDCIRNPDESILQFIKEHQIDLLIMGSVGRSGVAGIMIGNAAERLLPNVTCSVLVVKPPDFVCPICDNLLDASNAPADGSQAD